MSAQSRRPSRGDRKNQKASKPDRSEMTSDALPLLLDALSQLPPAKPRRPIDPEDIKRAARRGARGARRFLAENPAHDDMQAAWNMHEWEMHMLDDSPVDFAYHAAYLKTLERRVAGSPAARKDRDARPLLTLIGDYGTGSLLWLNWIADSNIGAGGRCCEAGRYGDADYRCGVHPISDELFEALKKWIAVFADAPWTEGTLIDPDDRRSFKSYLVNPAVILNWPDFHVLGLKLAKRLKQEVGAAFRVVYEKSKADPARQAGERHEVNDDGSVVALPPRRLFRFVC